MKRKRRTPEQAKKEIFTGVEELLLEEGPNALTLKNIAKKLGVSHPAILHHFGSSQQLLSDFQVNTARKIREDFLQVLSDNTDEVNRLQLIDAVLEKLSDPHNGRLLAYLISSGVDPFPAQEERGLEMVFSVLFEDSTLPIEELKNVLCMVMMCMYAEGMLGDHVRTRLNHQQDPASFRRWMLQMVSTHLELTRK